MSKNNDPLSPDFSPGSLDEKVGVRRVNKVPLMILAAGLAIFLIIIALVAFDRAEQAQGPQGRSVEKKKKSPNTVSFAKAAIGNNESGIIEASAPEATLTPPPELPALDDGVPATRDVTGVQAGPVLATVPPIRPMDGDPQLRPPGSRMGSNRAGAGSVDTSHPSLEQEVDKDGERLRELKFKMFENAVTSHSAVAYSAVQKVKSSGGTSSNTVTQPATNGTNSRDADLARLAAIEAELSNTDAEENEEAENTSTGSFEQQMSKLRSGSAPSRSAPPTLAGTAKGRNNLASFDGDSDRWKLNTHDEAPAPYQLTTGHIISTVLLTSINSELPGPIIAQVTRDIYDTATGKHVLIPHGTKVYGSYSSEIVFGQASLMVAVQRLVYPDGKTRDIGSMPAADAAGNTGMRDKVNNHFIRTFGSAFLLSGITAGVSLSQPNQSGESSQPTARSAMSEALGQQLGQTASQMISKNLNIAPTLTIRAGYRFNIIVVKDLIFKKPYKPFDYAKSK